MHIHAFPVPNSFLARSGASSLRPSHAQIALPSDAEEHSPRLRPAQHPPPCREEEQQCFWKCVEDHAQTQASKCILPHASLGQGNRDLFRISGRCPEYLSASRMEYSLRLIRKSYRV